MIKEIVEVRQPIPAALLDCAAAPAVPTDGQDAAAIGGFIVDLDAAGADCRSKLARVRGLVRP